MKILINATALNSRGAFSVVNSFLYDMNRGEKYLKDKGVTLHFLVARKELCRYSNDTVKVEFEPLPIRGLYNKWKYERVILPRIIKQGRYDAYLSLQNYVLKNTNIKQFTLIHQPIPFSDLKFSELEFKNWIKYGLIMDRILSNQKKDVHGVVVQTEWLVHAIKKKYDYRCPIIVIRPSVRDIVQNNEPLNDFLQGLVSQEGLKLFYPTNKEKYKNNYRLIEAVEKYNNLYERKAILYITLEGNSSKYIKFVGRVPYKSIYTLYQCVEALIFPSLAETLGLPLLEARLNGIPIIASDLPYAREVGGHSAFYFNPRNVESIVNAIYVFSENRPQIRVPDKITGEASYMDYINFILKQSQESQSEFV